MTTRFTFTSTDGIVFSFADYLSFARWYFSHSRRIMKAAFSAETFARMNQLAVNSADARRRIA
jgi:hypothetical protein